MNVVQYLYNSSVFSSEPHRSFIFLAIPAQSSPMKHILTKQQISVFLNSVQIEKLFVFSKQD